MNTTQVVLCVDDCCIVAIQQNLRDRLTELGMIDFDLDSFETRIDPRFVQAVEELGPYVGWKYNGRIMRLTVVEVKTDRKICLGRDDRGEWVEEIHNRWLPIS